MRNEATQNMLDSIAKDVFGRTQDEAQDKQICIFCGGDASEFKNDISRKEYSISGMCQKCQDEIFE